MNKALKPMSAKSIAESLNKTLLSVGEAGSGTKIKSGSGSIECICQIRDCLKEESHL